MTKTQTLQGKITALHIGYGLRYPSIEIDKQQIKVAPVWFLLENDFELKAGEEVRVRAAASKTAGDPYLYALEITRLADNISLALRDANGFPLWAGPLAGHKSPARRARGAAVRIRLRSQP